MSALLRFCCLFVFGIPANCELLQVYPAGQDTLAASTGQSQAVILIHGLDLRLEGGNPALPRPQRWQSSTGPLVRAVKEYGDVFAFIYAQTTPVEEVARFEGLRTAVARVKALGYQKIVLLGYSAGGVIARHFIEENPACGVTKVIQVATPNGGSGWASVPTFGKVPKQQLPFVKSLTLVHREHLLNQRYVDQQIRIPQTIEFACILTSTSAKARGDGKVSCVSQWPKDFEFQGIPFIRAFVPHHEESMEQPACIKACCQLLSTALPRWDPDTAQQMRQLLHP